MIASLAWKEYREQRPIWLTVGLLAVALVYVVLNFVAPIGIAQAGTAKIQTLITICFTLSIGYGLISGALLIAGEREAGTLGFLDMAVCRRSTIWMTKTIVGAIGVFIFALALAGLLGMLPVAVQDLHAGRWGWLRELPLWSLYAFAGGLLGSATSQSVLRAASLGLFYCTAFLLIALLVSLVLTMPTAITGPDAFDGVFRAAITVLALAMLYCS
jgi:hypothetical protein